MVAQSAERPDRSRVCVWVGPAPTEAVEHAVEAGGRVLSPIEKASVNVWEARSHNVSAFAGLVHGGIKWVRLDVAGIENWFTAGPCRPHRRRRPGRGVLMAPAVADQGELR